VAAGGRKDDAAVSEVLIAWAVGLATGAGLMGVWWLVTERRAIELETRRAAHERALRRHADRSWYMAGPARLIDAPRPLRPRREREEENGR